MHHKLSFKEIMKKSPYDLSEEQMSWVLDTLEGMDTEQKIRQMFCTIAYLDDENYLKGISEGAFGGLMCRTMKKEELIHLASYIQSRAKIPYFIAGNMEAGMNQCCDTGTRVGCQMAIAATGNVENARKLGQVIGEEANALGMNWAFAPVIDIDMNWRNPITNTRTYGSDADTVAAMGAAYVKEVQKHGIAASIKHFPGDGVDERDQHLVTSINSLDADTWMETYGKVYKTSIDAGALTVMAGYIMQPAWSKRLDPSLKDEEILPGALSKELLTDLLRGKLGFNGTIITDSSAMAGLGCAMSRKDALPQCINAGCDMILFAKNMDEDLGYIRAAVENGVISEERINEAVARILALKAALKLPEKAKAGTLIPSMEKAAQVVGCEVHMEVSRQVADESIVLVKEEEGVFPITPQRYPRILVYPKESGATDLAFGVESRVGAVVNRLRREGFKVDVYKPSKGFEGVEAPVSQVTDNYDLLIYVANLATKSNQTVVRLEWAQPMGADCPVYIHDLPNIFISLENPYHLADVPRIRTYINTFGSTDEILDALVDKMMGRSPFKGKSPSDAFCGMWDTHLQ